MPQPGLIVRALIASPGDVQKERQAIPEVIAAWNATHSLQMGVIVEPVKWESHSTPGLDGRPQAMINEQLVHHCDLLIGVFWTRIGTETGVARSGTVEEIQQFHQQAKPVLLYFSSMPVAPDSIDSQQYSDLTKFREEMQKQGLFERYDDVGQFREKLTRHLHATVEKVVASYSGKADVRLNVLPGQAADPYGEVFADLEKTMSDLLGNLRENLAEHSLIRVLIVMDKKSLVYNWPDAHLLFTADEDPDIRSKVVLLCPPLCSLVSLWDITFFQ